MERREFTVAGEYQYNRSSPTRWIISHVLRYPWLPAFAVVTGITEAIMFSYAPVLVGQAFDLMLSPQRSMAGLTTIALARFGYVVDAIDSSEGMVERALRGAIEADLGDRVKVLRGNANSLAFEDGVFDLVLAIGVIPWLESPGPAAREMARVVKPGGTVVIADEVEHPYAWMREEHADVWLGFDQEQVERFFCGAGLTGYGYESLGMQ